MEEKNKTNEQGFAQSERGGRRRRGGKQRHHGRNHDNLQNAQNNKDGQNTQNVQNTQAQQKPMKGQEQGGNKQPSAQPRANLFNNRRNKPNKNQAENNAQAQNKNQQQNKAQPQQNKMQAQQQNKAQPQQSKMQAQPQQTKNQPQANKNQQNVKQVKEENRKDTYLYTLDGNLYVNLTNKCSNACDFCVRNERTSYYGNYLWLRQGDPTVEKVIAATKEFGDITRFKEVVFCGFGEPTYKMTEMLALCDFFHEKGLKTRLNTNGQGNLINKRDIVPEMKGKIDFVNISLNASCYEKYQPICRSQFRESGFEGMIEFAKICKRNSVACRFSIVDCIGEAEVEACKRLAESVRIPLYIRKYIQDS